MSWSKPDVAALTALIEAADWKWREDWGAWLATHAVGGPVADALHWECESCRPDVGWADWTSLRKDPSGTVTIHVDCGHCGNDYTYDAAGELLEEERR